MTIACATCEHEIADDPHDSTCANYTNDRVKSGELTGHIYKCPVCESNTIDDYLNGVVRQWHY
jgi:Zn finger protein HypA/HybF involved in hydrogenase expression